MSREKIDIEALLTWAYRDKMVIKAANAMRSHFYQPPSARSSSATLAQFAALGVRVDGSWSGLRSLQADVDDDALVVDDAVLRLEDVYAEFQMAGRVLLWTPTIAEAEGRIIGYDGDGVGRQYYLHHPKRASRPLYPLCASVMVVMHASRGTRPDWCPDWRRKRGRPARAGAIDIKGRVRHAADIDERELSLARAAYTVWRASLSWLATELEDKLGRFSVTGPAAESAPWLRDCPSENPVPAQNSFNDNLLKANMKISA